MKKLLLSSIIINVVLIVALVMLLNEKRVEYRFSALDKNWLWSLEGRVEELINSTKEEWNGYDEKISSLDEDEKSLNIELIEWMNQNRNKVVSDEEMIGLSRILHNIRILRTNTIWSSSQRSYYIFGLQTIFESISKKYEETQQGDTGSGPHNG